MAIFETAENIHSIKNVLSVSIHTLAIPISWQSVYACSDSTGLMEFLTQIKSVPTVGKIVWSEEVSVMERENKRQYR